MKLKNDKRVALSPSLFQGMAGDEGPSPVPPSAERAEGEPSSSGREDVVELLDGDEGEDGVEPARVTRGKKRRASEALANIVDLTGESDGEETPPVEEVQIITVLESPPRPAPAVMSTINCAICMDKVGAKELASTVCGHVFCIDCITQSMKTLKNCPTCRKSLRQTQVHRLYV